MFRGICLSVSLLLCASAHALVLLDDPSGPPACGPKNQTSTYSLIDTTAAEETYTPNLDILIPTNHQLQELPLSCEASSMSEWYNFFREKEGKYLVPESFIREKIPTFSLPLTRDPYGKLIWGDPDFGFVGDINGRQSSSVSRMTGYGVHAKGLERATKHLFHRIGYTIKRVPRSDAVIMASLDR